MMAPSPPNSSKRGNVNNARLAWILAAIAILLYIGGLFIKRG